MCATQTLERVLVATGAHSLSGPTTSYHVEPSLERGPPTMRSRSPRATRPTLRAELSGKL
jgi:hypothetical protein